MKTRYKIFKNNRWYPVVIHTFVDPKKIPNELKVVENQELSELFGPDFHFFFQTNICRYLIYKLIKNDPIHSGKLVHFITCDSTSIFGDYKNSFFPLCRRVYDFCKSKTLVQNQEQLKFYEETLMAPDPAEIEGYYKQIEIQNEMNEDYNRTKRSMFSFGDKLGYRGHKLKGKVVRFVGMKTGKVLGEKRL